MYTDRVRMRLKHGVNKYVLDCSHRVLPFWLLVASLVRGVAVPLMHCPYYQYTGAHFTDLGRMTG